MGRACWLVVTFVGCFVVCGCRAGDAGTPDAASDAGLDVAGDLTLVDGGGDASASEVVADGAVPGCVLLAPRCAAGTHCYPFPFAEMATGESRCAEYQPPDVVSPQCDSQVQCPGGSVCATLFGLSTNCRPLCDIDAPTCRAGMECIPLVGYPRAGLCL